MANNTEQLRDIFVKHFNLFEQGFYLTFTKCREKLLAEVEEWHEAEASRREQAARVDENAWSRQQMIAAQAMEAPNSGFGRMVKWAISLLNERKLALLSTAAELKRQAKGEK